MTFSLRFRQSIAGRIGSTLYLNVMFIVYSLSITLTPYTLVSINKRSLNAVEMALTLVTTGVT